MPLQPDLMNNTMGGHAAPFDLPGFIGQTQGPSNWCWVAAAASISAYYAAQSNGQETAWTQCGFITRAIAGAATPPPGACMNIPPGPTQAGKICGFCGKYSRNRQGRLTDALAWAGHLAPEGAVPGPPNSDGAARIRDEILTHRRPVGVEVTLPSGTLARPRYHFVVIHGVIADYGFHIWNPDPSKRDQTVFASEFTAKVGQWRWTVFTRAQQSAAP